MEIDQQGNKPNQRGNVSFEPVDEVAVKLTVWDQWIDISGILE